MAVTNWPSILNTLSAAIEGITPSISASVTFKEIDRHEDIEKLPASQPFRYFFIEGGSASMEEDIWTNVSIRLNRDFDVVVSYRSDRGPQFNDRALEEMLGSDAEQLVDHLQRSTSRAAGLNWVYFEGFDIEKTDIRTYLHVKFSCNYDINFTA